MILIRARSMSRRIRPSILVLAAVAGVLHAAPVAAQAAAQATPQEETGATGVARPWSVGARALFASFSEDSLDNALGLAGFGVYQLNTDLEVELEAAWARADATTDALPEGTLSVMPIRGTVRLQLWRFRGAEPYAGGGAGIYLADFSIADGVVQDLEQLGFTVSQNVESGVGLHAAAGVEWRRERYRFGLDVKYVIGNLDASSRIVDEVTGLTLTDSTELDLDGLWISFGVRFQL